MVGLPTHGLAVRRSCAAGRNSQTPELSAESHRADPHPDPGCPRIESLRDCHAPVAVAAEVSVDRTLTAAADSESFRLKSASLSVDRIAQSAVLSAPLCLQTLRAGSIRFAEPAPTRYVQYQVLRNA